MLERDLQKYFLKRCSARGWFAVKTDSSSRRGWPDITLVQTGGVIQLVELKTLSGCLSVHQKRVHAEIVALGGVVHVLSGREAVDHFLNTSVI